MRWLSSEQARQGRQGRPVLLVLLGGLALAGVIALVLYPYQQDAGTLEEAQSVEDITEMQ